MPSPPDEMLKKHLICFSTSIDSEIISGAYEPRFGMYALGTANGYLYIINKHHQTFRSPKSVNYPLLRIISLPNSSSFFSICSKTMFQNHASRVDKPNPHDLIMLNSIKSSKVQNICTHWIIKPEGILSRTTNLEFDIVDIALSPVHPEFALLLTSEGSLYGFSIESLNLTNLYINIFEKKPVKSICWSSGYRFLIAHDIIEGLDVQKLELGSQYKMKAQMIDSIDQWTTAIDEKGVPNLFMYTNIVSSINVPKGSRAIYSGMLNSSNWTSIIRSEKGDIVYENKNPKVKLDGEFAIPQVLIKYGKPFERSNPQEVAVCTDYGRFIYLDGKVIDHFTYQPPDVKFAFADEEDYYVFTVEKVEKVKKKKVIKKKNDENKIVFRKESDKKKDDKDDDKTKDTDKKEEEKEIKKKDDDNDDKKEDENKIVFRKESGKKKDDKDDDKTEDTDKKEEDEDEHKASDKEEDKENEEEKKDDDDTTKDKDEDKKSDDDDKEGKDEEKKKEEEEKQKKKEEEEERKRKEEEEKQKKKEEEEKKKKEEEEKKKKEEEEKKKKEEEEKKKKEEEEKKRREEEAKKKKEEEEKKKKDKEDSNTKDGDTDQTEYEDLTHFIVYRYRHGVLHGHFKVSSAQVSNNPLGISHEKVLFVENDDDVCFFDLKSKSKSLLQTLDTIVSQRHTKRRFPDFVLESGSVIKTKATEDGFGLEESDEKCPSQNIIDWRPFKDSIVYFVTDRHLVFKDEQKKIIKEADDEIIAFDVVNYLGHSPKDGDEEYIVVVTSSRIVVLDYDNNEKKLRKVRKMKMPSTVAATFTKFGTLIVLSSSQISMLPLPDVSSSVIDKIPISKDGRAALFHKFGAIVYEPNSVSLFLEDIKPPKLYDINSPVMETPKVNKFLKLFGKKDDTVKDADTAFQYSRSSAMTARINETQDMMQTLLVKANERGEMLNEMEIKSNKLLTSAQKFHQLARELRKNPWF